MSEAPPPAPRPQPLRVPVVDVATRNSLVSPTPRPPAAVAVQPAVVIQRAVRVLSDAPPSDSAAPERVAHTPSAPGSLVDSVLGALPDAPERVFVPHEVPQAPATLHGAASPWRGDEDASRGADETGEHPRVQDTPSDVPTAPRASMPTPGLSRVPIPPPPAARSLEGELRPVARSPEGELRPSGTQPPAEPRASQPSAAMHAERYAQAEVDALDPLELAEGFDDEDDTLDDPEPEEEHVLDVSLPPPAPPEALRKSSPSNDNDQGDVEITVSDDLDDEPSRPSGEFEEIDLSTDDGNTPGEGQRSFPPPPPPPRLQIPEPPDLSTLTRTARVQEIRPSKPRSHPWWEVFFDDDYLRTVRPPTSEQIARQCDFIEKRLKLKPGATLLDVGCGLGLSVVELCTRGYLGVGLDLSLAMLSRASEEAQGRGMRINFLHSDMRDMNFEGAFDGLMCFGTTFGYFDDDTNKKVLERFLRALKPGGHLLLDVVNRDHVIRAQPNLVWFEGDGCVCMEESEFNFFTSRLHVKRTVILDGGKQAETEYSLRLYSLHELGQLLHSAGFRVLEVSGREALPGVFFGQESPQMIILAERRGPDQRTDTTGKYSAVVSD